jgi:hypothetical protein
LAPWVAAWQLTAEEVAAAVKRAVRRVDPWLQRLSCLVVGPGLGSDPLVVATTVQLLQLARYAQASPVPSWCSCTVWHVLGAWLPV